MWQSRGVFHADDAPPKASLKVRRPVSPCSHAPRIVLMDDANLGRAHLAQPHIARLGTQLWVARESTPEPTDQESAAARFSDLQFRGNLPPDLPKSLLVVPHRFSLVSVASRVFCGVNPVHPLGAARCFAGWSQPLGVGNPGAPPRKLSWGSGGRQKAPLQIQKQTRSMMGGGMAEHRTPPRPASIRRVAMHSV